MEPTRSRSSRCVLSPTNVIVMPARGSSASATGSSRSSTGSGHVQLSEGGRKCHCRASVVHPPCRWFAHEGRDDDDDCSVTAAGGGGVPAALGDGGGVDAEDGDAGCADSDDVGDGGSDALADSDGSSDDVALCDGADVALALDDSDGGAVALALGVGDAADGLALRLRVASVSPAALSPLPVEVCGGCGMGRCCMGRCGIGRCGCASGAGAGDAKKATRATTATKARTTAEDITREEGRADAAARVCWGGPLGCSCAASEAAPLAFAVWWDGIAGQRNELPQTAVHETGWSCGVSGTARHGVNVVLPTSDCALIFAYACVHTGPFAAPSGYWSLRTCRHVFGQRCVAAQ